MAYNNAIPTASQRLKDSQPQLLENFATISALLSVDHVTSPWTDPVSGNEGKHNKVTMPEQTVVPTTLVDEMALYTKVVNNVSELFVRRENNGTEINITSSSQIAEGYSFLPSGLLIKWGYVVGSGPRDATQPAHSFPVSGTIPVFSSILHVTVSSTNRINNVVTAAARQFTALQAFTTTDITVRTAGATAATGTATDWTYLAIGLP